MRAPEALRPVSVPSAKSLDHHGPRCARRPRRDDDDVSREEEQRRPSGGVPTRSVGRVADWRVFFGDGTPGNARTIDARCSGPEGPRVRRRGGVERTTAVGVGRHRARGYDAQHPAWHAQTQDEPPRPVARLRRIRTDPSQPCARRPGADRLRTLRSPRGEGLPARGPAPGPPPALTPAAASAARRSVSRSSVPRFRPTRAIDYDAPAMERPCG